MKTFTLNAELVKKHAKKISIWNNIYHVRKYRGFSQEQLAELIWSSQKYISEIESWEKDFWVTKLYDIANALQVNSSLLWEPTVKRKVFEFIDYMLSKIWEIDGFLKLNKICYFTELESIELFKEKFLGLHMVRYNRWPFTKELYTIRNLFNSEVYFSQDYHCEVEKITNNNPFHVHTLLEDDDYKFIDDVIEKYAHLSAAKLSDLAYATEPMKRLGATKWWNEYLNTVLI